MARASSETLATDVEKQKEDSTLPSPTEVIVKKEIEDGEKSEKDALEVKLSPEEDPRNLPGWRKALIIFVVCTAACCGTCATSVVCPVFKLLQTKRF